MLGAPAPPTSPAALTFAVVNGAGTAAGGDEQQEHKREVVLGIVIQAVAPAAIVVAAVATAVTVAAVATAVTVVVVVVVAGVVVVIAAVDHHLHLYHPTLTYLLTYI